MVSGGVLRSNLLESWLRIVATGERLGALEILLLIHLSLLHVVFGGLELVQPLTSPGRFLLGASLVVSVGLCPGHELFDVRVVSRLPAGMRIEGRAAVDEHLGLRRNQPGHLLGTLTFHDCADRLEALVRLLSGEFACAVFESQVDPSVVDSDELLAGGSVHLCGARGQFLFLLLPSVGFSISRGLDGLPRLFLLRIHHQLILRNFRFLPEFDAVEMFLLHCFDIQESIIVGVVMSRGAFPGDLQHLAGIELLFGIARALFFPFLWGCVLFKVSLFRFYLDVLVVLLFAHHKSLFNAEVAY